MEFVADLHLHSRHSRATAKTCDLHHFALWARKKGVSVLGTGDVTHPGWREELKADLVPAEPGLFRLRDEADRAVLEQVHPSCHAPVRFALTVEISTIYKAGERTRKVHHVVLLPDFEAVDKLVEQLTRIGNLHSDGRPILGLDSRDLLEMVLESGEGSALIPAHIWTPWFAVLGSKSGFDAVDDCYRDLAPHIFAVETGLSSDPPMNWRVSSLDRFRLISSSDAHSPPVLARNAVVFDGERDYFAILDALRTGDGYAGTIEFFPEEGKYHLDGHRKCDVRMEPAITRANDGLCPVCSKPVTVGVMHRVEELADQPVGREAPLAGRARHLIPLPEILGEVLGVGSKSKTVSRAYETLLSRLGPELAILQERPLDAIREASSPLLADGIDRLRRGRVTREAGYDGEYGVIRLFDDEELERASAGGMLFDLPKPRKRRKPRNSGATVGLSGRVFEPARPGKPTVAPAESSRPESLRASLDDEQRAAAEIVAGPLLIVAGPGSGKTRTLTTRIALLVREHGVAPEACLAITFTRRAAGELGERLGALLGEDAAKVPVHTFHGLGLELLREHAAAAGLEPGFRVADDTERLALLQEVTRLGKRKARKLLGDVSRAKRTGEIGALLASDGNAAALARALDERALLDFDDLVARTAGLLERDETVRAAVHGRYRFVSVDEYQDVDAQQVRLVRALVPDGGNLCAIGDPDQAIYGFRGADAAHIGRFASDFPGARVMRLTRNYRSGRSIVEASGQVIAAGPADAVERRLNALLDTPERVVIHQAATERAEAEFVVHTTEKLLGGHSFFSVDSGRTAGLRDSRMELDLTFSDIAVLYRTDAQADALSEAFARSGMPFQRRSHGRLAEHPGVRVLIEQLAAEPGDGPLAARLRAAEARAVEGRKPADVTAIRAAVGMLDPLAEVAGDDLARFVDDLAMGAEVDSWDPRAQRISLLTLHAAKGLEFRVVFIVGCEQGLLPLAFGDHVDPAAVVEERRLFYVGMTRTIQQLYLCHARKRRWRGRIRERQPSPFLRDIEEQLLERSATRAGGKRTRDDQLKLF
jgi:DNA helicase II / ATP-dependent DNA helicase PcrA